MPLVYDQFPGCRNNTGGIGQYLIFQVTGVRNGHLCSDARVLELEPCLQSNCSKLAREAKALVVLVDYQQSTCVGDAIDHDLPVDRRHCS